MSLSPEYSSDESRAQTNHWRNFDNPGTSYALDDGYVAGVTQPITEWEDNSEQGIINRIENEDSVPARKLA
jgi:hypothetical protein